MKVGIISGTFDPVHSGHLSMAQLATNELGLDEVWFLPERSPRNKQGVTSYQHRLKMVNLALQNKPFFYLVEVEQDSHDLETLKEITEPYSQDINHEFYLLFGADVIRRMQSWGNLDELKKLATIISVGRNGEQADLNFEHSASSKTIREQIAKNQQPENLNEKVLKYIHEHKLFQS